MSKNKTTRKLVDAKPKKQKGTTLTHESIVKSEGFSFSFKLLDRTHKLFNLGDDSSNNSALGDWFLDFLDCLKDVNGKTFQELQGGKFDLHPIDWSKTNVQKPNGYDQHEFHQFRINKSKGRIIGIKIGNIFYIVWLDRHHNLTNSEGYSPARPLKHPKSEYEKILEENEQLKRENNEYKELFDNYE